MSIKDTVNRLIGRGESEEDQEEPSHICASCGEQYYTDPEFEIDECRSCGGAKVERVDA